MTNELNGAGQLLTGYVMRMLLRPVFASTFIIIVVLHSTTGSFFIAEMSEQAAISSPGRRTSLVIRKSLQVEGLLRLSKVKDIWGIEPDISSFHGANFAVGMRDEQDLSPPILELPHFLSAEECQLIQSWAQDAIRDGADECDDYLNYRVNNEVKHGGESAEGKVLIDEFQLNEATLSAKHRGGFRVRVENRLVEELLKERILQLLGLKQRSFVFEEGAWIRPTPRTVVVRDQTIVFYGPGNGVPPHVDGKDGTLLVYLSEVPDGVGGRTVFPEDGFAQRPVQGTALLYRSKRELLHYSEAMQYPHEKWIMQLLLDFNHQYQKGDTITCFRTGESYVWDGS